MSKPTLQWGGNRYKSLSVSIPGSTTDYSICKENPSLFPDWNENWDERDYWTICVIKNLTKEIKVKFHDETYNAIILTTKDIPAIFEPFVFRDVYITNENGSSVEFDISFFNNRTINPPPYKPKNLTYEINGNNVILYFENTTAKGTSFDEDYFKIERAISGFSYSQIGTIKSIGSVYARNPVISYTDKSVAPGTYTYRVRAYNEKGGNSPYSNEITVIMV